MCSPEEATSTGRHRFTALVRTTSVRAVALGGTLGSVVIASGTRICLSPSPACWTAAWNNAALRVFYWLAVPPRISRRVGGPWGFIPLWLTALGCLVAQGSLPFSALYSAGWRAALAAQWHTAMMRAFNQVAAE